MSTILKNILQFTNLAVGVPTALPHGLNVNDVAVAPQVGGADKGGFDITADATNVTVTRTAAATSDACHVYVEHWHTIEEALPLPGQLAGLTPLFFAGSSSQAQALLVAADVESFSFVATPNTLTRLTGNHEVAQTATLPLAADAGNGARCGFKLAAGNAGPVWDVGLSGADTLDVPFSFPDNTTGDYVEFITDGISRWFIRSVYP